LPRQVEARADAALIKGLMRRTAQDLIDIGSALARQKEALPHGQFIPWISAEFSMSERTAQKLMAIGRGFAKTAAPADLGVEALYELSSANADIQAEVERRIAAGEIIGASDVKRYRSLRSPAGSRPIRTAVRISLAFCRAESTSSVSILPREMRRC